MAKSRNIGGIFAELSLKDSNFKRGLKGAERGLDKFARLSNKALRVVGTAGTAAVAAASAAMTAYLTAGTKKTIAAGAELDHLSSQTGVAVSSLMKIQQAYKDNGKSADSAGKDINKMQRAIYEASQDPGGSMDFFAELGLSAAELMAMTPEEQFFAIGDAINKVENRTKRAALAMDIFGRSGGQLLTVFSGTSLDDVNASLGRMPEIMNQFSGAMERADTLMGRLPNKSDQFLTGFTAGVIGEILPALEAVNAKDFTALGENLGQAIATGMDMIISGDIWTAFRLGYEKAFLQMEQKMTGGLFNSIFAHINAAFDTSGRSFAEGVAHYSAPGKDGGQAEIDMIQKELDELWNQSKKRTAARRSAASEQTGPSPADFLSDSDLESIFGIKSAMESAPEALKDAAQPASFESAQYSANEMQRRGLGQGAMYAGKEDKKVTLITEIKNIIKEISLRPPTDPTWA